MFEGAPRACLDVIGPYLEKKMTADRVFRVFCWLEVQVMDEIVLGFSEILPRATKHETKSLLHTIPTRRLPVAVYSNTGICLLFTTLKEKGSP